MVVKINHQSSFIALCFKFKTINLSTPISNLKVTFNHFSKNLSLVFETYEQHDYG